MKKILGFYGGAALLLMLSQGARCNPTTGISTTETIITTTTIETDDTTSKDALRESRSIRAYCAEIDRFIAKNHGAKREFARVFDETAKQFHWTEIASVHDISPEILVTAVTYARNGKCIYVECLTRNRRNALVNSIRYYFRPDGSLAKSRATVRAFQTPQLDNKVIVVTERLKNSEGNWVDYNTEYRDPKTGKNTKSVIYSAELQSGSCKYSVSRLRDLCFFDLLRKPKSKR